MNEYCLVVDRIRKAKHRSCSGNNKLRSKLLNLNGGGDVLASLPPPNSGGLVSDKGFIGPMALSDSASQAEANIPPQKVLPAKESEH